MDEGGIEVVDDGWEQERGAMHVGEVKMWKRREGTGKERESVS